jgi:hypothetical protein
LSDYIKENGGMEQLAVRMREVRNSYTIFIKKQREEMALDDNIKVSVNNYGAKRGMESLGSG